MVVIKSKLIGFCYGVRRAAQMALDLRSSGYNPVYTLGPLMHNPLEVNRLQEVAACQCKRLSLQ